ncbi:MAG: hypothetical protein EXQ55_01135 [Acidobacteria bacterium]|nr:hypothetical protein [Acidobacteriota bacterium]
MYAGHVGTGFTQRELERAFARLKPLAIKAPRSRELCRPTNGRTGPSRRWSPS